MSKTRLLFLRLVAFSIDFMCGSIPSWPLLYCFHAVVPATFEAEHPVFVGLFSLILYFLGFAVFHGFMIGKWGWSIGKKCVGVEVVSLESQKVGFYNGFLREVFKILNMGAFPWNLVLYYLNGRFWYDSFLGLECRGKTLVVLTPTQVNWTAAIKDQSLATIKAKNNFRRLLNLRQIVLPLLVGLVLLAHHVFLGGFVLFSLSRSQYLDLNIALKNWPPLEAILKDSLKDGVVLGGMTSTYVNDSETIRLLIGDEAKGLVLDGEFLKADPGWKVIYLNYSEGSKWTPLFCNDNLHKAIHSTQPTKRKMPTLVVSSLPNLEVGQPCSSQNNVRLALPDTLMPNPIQGPNIAWPTLPRALGE